MPSGLYLSLRPLIRGEGVRAFDLDNIRPQISKDLGPVGPLHPLREIQHPYAPSAPAPTCVIAAPIRSARDRRAREGGASPSLPPQRYGIGRRRGSPPETEALAAR